MRLLSPSLAVLCALAVCTQGAVMAQAPKERKASVGVALSGGGAFGLAHIGVLQYFEEHHIPVDALAGTSMGGLVGGLYATGLDSGQLTEIIEQADWNDLLLPSPKFINQPIVEKQKWNRTFGDLSLQFEKGFTLPLGVNSGEALSLLLSRLTLPYSNVSNFDELPIPFRCVATDLITGKAVILQRGSLPQAMRATMSIPGIFTPVRSGDMVLVDGGLVQTIPVEVVRDMGAENVIAVAFENPPVRPEQMKSLPDVLRQTGAVTSAQNERRSLLHADLIIAVDTARFSMTDYDRWREIIRAGYEAASARSDALKRFELSPDEWAAYLQQRNSRMRPAVSRAQVASVEAPSASFQKSANAEIHRKLDGRSISPQELEQVLAGMAAATAVPAATYEWKDGTGGPSGYQVTFSQRPGDQILVRPSFQYRLSTGEPDQTLLRISTSIAFANAYKSRLLGTLDIGYDPGLQMEYYQPFDGTSYFLAPEFFVQRHHVNSYQGASRKSDTRDRFGGAFYVGIGTWRFAQLRAGIQAGYDSYSSRITVDGIEAKSGAFVAPEMRWTIDSQDSGGLPTRGVLAEGSARIQLSRDRASVFPAAAQRVSAACQENLHFRIKSAGYKLWKEA